MSRPSTAHWVVVLSLLLGDWSSSLILAGGYIRRSTAFMEHSRRLSKKRHSRIR
jgi:hypothetical protein